MLHRTKELIEQNLCQLFDSCGWFIYMYEDENIDVDDVAFRTRSAERREAVWYDTRNCIHLIDEMVGPISFCDSSRGLTGNIMQAPPQLDSLGARTAP